MKIRREFAEIISEIKSKMPEFNKDELIEYTKWAIPALYNSLRDEKNIEVKCNPELINNLNKEKSKYKIDKNIDHMSIQYAELFDVLEKDNELYIQLYLSIYFYDDVENNVTGNLIDDKYWNDIWIVTYGREKGKSDQKNSNCFNCGAIMNYNKAKNMFECEYCGNIVNNNSYSKWEIVNVELGN